MSAPVKKCEVTPLQALLQLIGAASLIDADECKDEIIYSTLQNELVIAKEVAKALAASPVVPVAAQPVVQQEPVAYLRFRAAQKWSGMGGHDIEYAEWLETCQAHEIGDDKLPAFPVYAAPSLEAQPAETIKYGCHIDLPEGHHDNCVLDGGNRDDCSYARLHGEEGRKKCGEWKPIKIFKEQPAGAVIPAEKLCALLPGPYYMDPPDGGSVTVLEQVERMAKDAARFAWLIENASSGSLGFGDWWINGDEPAEEWRAAIDAAMAQGEKQ